ncbi:Neuroblast differentiation-associated protein AHNAK [Bagarius yarrelli]|uniref:Neuroblast differentiation-associated protein AHNAK n=1 Tax=Bagarius yarrelli TaxID=175774 RepID=A0A556TNS5_BAGYA|nr:Neuroblast differentiation-associated protein AHNAK [Bagarius yarrelli]
MPTISGPKISMPDVDFNLKGPKLKGDMDVSVPEIEGGIKAPKVKIEGPDLDVEGPEGGFKMPKIKMPSFGIKGPKLEGPDMDVNLPKADIDVKGPKIDIKSPDIDIEAPEGKIKGPKFKMPTISGPKISMPDVDFNLKGPKLKGDMDVSVPEIEGGIKAPKVKIEGPDYDVEGPEGGFKMPKIKMPSFGIKGPKLEGPDMDVNLPKADIDVKGPKMGIPNDLKSPDIDIEAPEGKIKGPKFKMPTISGPKISMPDVDFNLKGPKLKGDMDVSVPEIEGGIKAPKVKIEGPDLDVEGPEGGFKIPNIKMPSFGIKGPKLESPDMDVNLPKADIDVKGPKIDIKSPDIDIEAPEGKIKGPKFKMPSISGPKISMPDVDFNLKGPKLKGDMDVSVPEIEGGIKPPKVEIEGPDLDVGGLEGGFKMPKIKMPSFGIKGSRLEGPDMDVNLPKADIDVKGHEVDLHIPDVDIKGPEGKIQGPKFKMPSISGPKISMPDVDFNLTGPKLKGEMDMSVPKSTGDFKAPKVEIERPDFDVDGPEGDINLKGKKGKLKMPKVKGKLKTDVNVDSKTGNVELAADSPDLTLKGPKVKKPLFGKIHFPDVEFDVKPSKVKGGGSVSGKSVEFDSSPGNLKADISGANIQSPVFTLESAEVKTKKSKIKMPKLISGSKVKSADVDITVPKLQSPDMSVNLGAPDVSFEGQVVEVRSSLRDPNIKGSFEGRVKGFKDAEGFKAKGSQGVDINLPTAKFDAQHASCSDKRELGMPAVEYTVGNVTFPKMKVPKFGIALPQVEGTEMGVDVGSGELTAGGNVGSSLEVPCADLKISGSKVKSRKPRFFGKSKPKGGSAADLTFQAPEVEATIEGGAKVSKGLSASSGELIGGKIVEGGSGLKISPKSKSASLDLYKKSRHRSSSLSDEGELASPASVEGHLQTEGGNIMMDVGGAKVKGKKGVLKFGTFGGFSSKSKGSYEVTLGEDSEATVEGAGGVVSHSKKSRVSSTSSSDSVSKSGFRFPKVEIAVSPKK